MSCTSITKFTIALLGLALSTPIRRSISFDDYDYKVRKLYQQAVFDKLSINTKSGISSLF